MDWFGAAAVVLTGTVNLWKIQTVRDILPVDATLAAALIGMVAAGVVWFPSRWRLPAGWVVLAVGFISFLPAVAVTSFGTAYSVDKVRSLFTLSLLTAIVPMVVLTTAARRRATMAILVGLGAATSAGLLFAGTTNPNTGRVGVEDGSPIGLARLTCIAVAILGVVAIERRGATRYLALGGLVVAAGATVTTGSRGPLASAFLAPLLALVLTRHGRGLGASLRSFAMNRRLVLRLIFVTGAVLVALLLSLRLASRLALAHLLSLGGESSSWRLDLLRDSFTLAVHHPIGVGWGDLATHLPTAASEYTGTHLYPHNVLAEAAAEGGILAFLGLVWLLVASFRRIRSAARSTTDRALLAVWLFSVASAMTSSDLIGNRLMWMAIGAGLAYPRVVAATARLGGTDTGVPSDETGLAGDQAPTRAEQEAPHQDQ
ncbi:O-antigen ligase family protein [Isoptericola sp. b441]|uniref:O-antigen ligase family protein n=1 Tax=Actinotalea lenta TaxID=3064654 RepID=A0ABT9DFB7_9CELL|nr:O-antigen ligase family protein [Isoptericola sp. b441]MDO8108507.1 O-antigen ligase family protein [Isoptericola sp. b441]